MTISLFTLFVILISRRSLFICKYLVITCLGIALLAILGGCDRKPHPSLGAESKARSHESDIANLNIHHQLVIRVDGNKLRNENDETIQLRGVSLMGMEYNAIDGQTPGNPYPEIVESTWSALHNWHINAIRIPLNETSYLGLECVSSFTGPAYEKPGKIIDADPGHNYKEKLKEVIDRATKEGLYIILDLHMTAPDDPLNKVKSVTAQCATNNNPLPDKDHSIDFWRSLANAYKDYPNVMFELFNNPYIEQWRYFQGDKSNAWKAIREGTVVSSYLPLWPTKAKHLWQSVGMQELIDTVRNTGSRNIVLIDGLSRSSDLDQWLTFKVTDPINQVAASWHAFPSTKAKWGDKCYPHPGDWCDDRAFTYASQILDAGIPVIVAEFGDLNASGTIGSPFASNLLPRLDKMGISYLGWTFTASTWTANQLILDDLGTPTDGYGQYVQAHYICRDTKKESCDDLERNISSHPVYFKQQSSASNIRGWAPSPRPL